MRVRKKPNHLLKRLLGGKNLTAAELSFRFPVSVLTIPVSRHRIGHAGKIYPQHGLGRCGLNRSTALYSWQLLGSAKEGTSDGIGHVAFSRLS